MAVEYWMSTCKVPRSILSALFHFIFPKDQWCCFIVINIHVTHPLHYITTIFHNLKCLNIVRLNCFQYYKIRRINNNMYVCLLCAIINILCISFIHSTNICWVPVMCQVLELWRWARNSYSLASGSLQCIGKWSRQAIKIQSGYIIKVQRRSDRENLLG